MFHRLWTGLLNRVCYTLVCTIAFITFFSSAPLQTFTGLHSVRAAICRHFLLVDMHEVFKEVKYFTVWYLTRCYRPWYVIVVRSNFARADFIHYHHVNWREIGPTTILWFPSSVITTEPYVQTTHDNVAKFCYLLDVVTYLLWLQIIMVENSCQFGREKL